MTTPYSPSQIQLFPSPPVQIWAGITNGPPVLLSNQDPVSPVYVSYANSIGVGGTNAASIAPLTTLIMDGSRTIWGVAPAGTQPLQVIPGGSSLTASPVAEAIAIIESGLALQIAQAIAGTGLPLIGNPTVLYNVSSVPPASGAGLVGCTIPNSAFKNQGCYDFGLTQQQADSKFCGIVGRGLASNLHLTCTKKYWGNSDFDTTKNDMANYAAFGTRVIACLNPVFFAGFPAGTNFRTSGLMAPAQQAAANADYTSIGTFITAMLGLGFTASTLVIVLWQEPGVKSKGMSSTDFGNMLLTYGPAVNATVVGLVPDIDSGIGATAAQAYANAAVGVAGVTYAGLAQDLYLPTWQRGNVTPDTIGSIADAHGLAYGLYEVGCAPNNFTNQDCINYMLGQHASGGNYGVLDYMQHRLQNNLPNLDTIYYDGDCSASGAGALSSPIGQDPTVAQPDFRIPLFQQWFDTLASVPSTALTITPNTTTTLTPANPSPVGGLAPANFLSYEIAIGLTAGVGSTNPFVSVILNWFDFDQLPRNQNAIAKEVWHLPMGANGDANGPLAVYGSGRMHGSFLQVKINNQDTVACTVSYLTITGTSRTGQRSTWYWNPSAGVSPAVPTFTLAQSADQSLQTGRIQGINILTGGTADYLCGLFAGQVFVRIYATGAAANGTVSFQLSCQPAGVFSTSNLINESVGASQNEQLFTVASPRCPLKMHIKNNDANTVTVDFEVVGIETS